ncbi:zinc-binding alcohol dehydrogenase family protein [Aureivirga sp. CE67]|uniref:quinone oxidoreductase family protein n=1 Tax=Aureivirga sp. CE67 TaxID=1788983 RepID=UPI0018C99285|nr:zinc-binding dehydrogenase [Aureivirga sp. CE67]
MKASIIRKFGDTDVLEYTTIDTPKPASDEVLIKILATGVNRLDHYLREGKMMPNIPFPHILGSDAVGEILEIGVDVNNFEIGERVIPVPGYPMKKEEENINPMTLASSYGIIGAANHGTYAEYIKVPAKFVIKDTTNLSPELIATLPMVAVTGVRAVKEVGEVKKGDKVVVLAGASGTGSFNIQIAKALGAEVLSTTTSDTNIDFIKNLGADVVINSKKEDLISSVQKWTNGKGADVVIDNLGGKFLNQSIELLKPKGILVSMGFVDSPNVSFDVRSLFFKQISIKGSIMGTKEDLEFAIELVKQGKIKPLLDTTLPLSDANKAHDILVNGKVKGNIVLIP